jgi:hypothetical protein
MFRHLKSRRAVDRGTRDRPGLTNQRLGRTIYLVLATVLVLSLAIGFRGLNESVHPDSALEPSSFGAQDQAPQ